MRSVRAVTGERRAIKEVLRYCDAQGLNGASGGMEVHVDDNGTAHTRGGYWLSTTDRVVYGYTLENARVVQRILARAKGWPERKLHKAQGRDKRGRVLACRCKPCRDIRASISEYCTIERAEGDIIRALSDPASYTRDRSAKRMKRLRAKVEGCQARSAGCTRDVRPGLNPRTSKPYRTCESCNAKALAIVTAKARGGEGCRRFQPVCRRRCFVFLTTC